MVVKPGRRLSAEAGVGGGCQPRHPRMKSTLEKEGCVLPLPNGNDSTPLHVDDSPIDRNFGVTLETRT